MWVSMCSNRVRSLIVSEKENDIGTGCAFRLHHAGKDQANDKGDSLHSGVWRTQLILRDHTSGVIKKYCGVDFVDMFIKTAKKKYSKNIRGKTFADSSDCSI